MANLAICCRNSLALLFLMSVLSLFKEHRSGFARSVRTDSETPTVLSIAPVTFIQLFAQCSISFWGLATEKNVNFAIVWDRIVYDNTKYYSPCAASWLDGNSDFVRISLKILQWGKYWTVLLNAQRQNKGTGETSWLFTQAIQIAEELCLTLIALTVQLTDLSVMSAIRNYFCFDSICD